MHTNRFQRLMNLRRLAAGAVLTAAAGLALGGLAGTAEAAPHIGRINGHSAVALGPYATAAHCQLTADRLNRFGAKRFGQKFGTCYQADNGQWFAISPWAQ